LLAAEEKGEGLAKKGEAHGKCLHARRAPRRRRARRATIKGIFLSFVPKQMSRSPRTVTVCTGGSFKEPSVWGQASFSTT
jgi:hypothetical protein